MCWDSEPSNRPGMDQVVRMTSDCFAEIEAKAEAAAKAEAEADAVAEAEALAEAASRVNSLAKDGQPVRRPSLGGQGTLSARSAIFSLPGALASKLSLGSPRKPSTDDM